MEAIPLDSPFGLETTFDWPLEWAEPWECLDYGWGRCWVRLRFEYTDPTPRDSVILMIDAGPYGQRIGGYYNGRYLTIHDHTASFYKDWPTLRDFFIEMGITPPDVDQEIEVTLRLPVAYTEWHHRMMWIGSTEVGYWKTTDRYALPEPSYEWVDAVFTFVSVAQLPPELKPAPVFVTDLCLPKEDTLSPTEATTFNLVIENSNENAGEIYIGLLCGDNWEVLHTQQLGTSRISYSLSRTPEELANKAFAESEILPVDFVVGYTVPGYEQYKPETVTGRWRATLFVIVGEPPVYTCPHCGQTFPSKYQLDQHVAEFHGGEDWKRWGIPLAVGAVAVGGIIYATRKK